MPLEFDSFRSSIFIHIRDRFDIIVKDYNKFIDLYFYIYIVNIPFIMYYNPLFIINNLTNTFITLFYIMYGCDKIIPDTSVQVLAHKLSFRTNFKLCFIVPYTCMFDMMVFNMYHDVIIYVFIIATIIAKAEMIYTYCYATYFLLRDKDTVRKCAMMIDSYIADLENEIDDSVDEMTEDEMEENEMEEDEMEENEMEEDEMEENEMEEVKVEEDEVEDEMTEDDVVEDNVAEVKVEEDEVEDEMTEDDVVEDNVAEDEVEEEEDNVEIKIINFEQIDVDDIPELI